MDFALFSRPALALIGSMPFAPLVRRLVIYATATLAGWIVLSSTRAAESPVLFDLADVQVLDGPFKHAQALNEAYLLDHDVDRFLAPFRVEAGLEPKAPKYPNWESTGLDGHTAGHYLTALAQMAVVTNHPEIKKKLEYMVAELAACQSAHGNGYVGAVPGSKELWRDVAAGRIRVDNFSINGKWVPWYNLHKLFAGLRDAWLIAENQQAREVLIGLANWCDVLVAQLSDEQMQEMLRAEHGGMDEVLADLSEIAADAKYLALAKRFSHRAILEPLLRREDRLDGLHANTQIPKVIGFARIAELGGDSQWADGARFFWETVTSRRSIAFGGNSVREHFNPAGDFTSMVESREGPETCNTYNMLRLSEALFRLTPDPRYVDYYERALFNHILSSQHPAHGGFVYFTPIRPRHYRVYSQAGQCFWCCVGSGMENHGKYGRFIYAHTDETLFVNLFLASELRWKERELRVRQETSFPDEAKTTLLFAMTKPQRLTLQLRHPSWVSAGALKLRLNGQDWPVTSAPSSYLPIDREWRDGDRLEIDLPMHTTIERLPDQSEYVAVLHGPIVLAAKTGEGNLDGLIAGDSRMGHIAPGPYEPLDQAPMLVGDPATIASGIHKVDGEPLTFTAQELIRPAQYREIKLAPFFRVHDARYMTYWRTATAEAYEDVVRGIAVQEKELLALEERTIDQVAPGEQQPEVEHNFQGVESKTGTNLGRAWRDTGGWISYDLKTRPQEAVELLVTYWAGERRRNFDILVNEQIVATVALDGREPDRFVDVTYAVPSAVVAAAGDGRLTVKFVAKDKSRAGAIYGVRTVAKAHETN